MNETTNQRKNEPDNDALWEAPRSSHLEYCRENRNKKYKGGESDRLRMWPPLAATDVGHANADDYRNDRGGDRTQHGVLTVRHRGSQGKPSREAKHMVSATCAESARAVVSRRAFATLWDWRREDA